MLSLPSFKQYTGSAEYGHFLHPGVFCVRRNSAGYSLGLQSGKTFVDDPLGFAVRILILSVKSSGEDSPEGADESGVSSSPSGNRSRGTPSVSFSVGLVTAFPRRRCRRKRRFIGTFRQSQPWYPVRRLLCRPCHRIPPAEGADGSGVSSAPSGNL